MSTAIKEVRRSPYIGKKIIPSTEVIFEDEVGMSDLELAKSRRKGEFISSEEFNNLMTIVINEKRSSKKGNKRV